MVGFDLLSAIIPRSVVQGRLGGPASEAAEAVHEVAEAVVGDILGYRVVDGGEVAALVNERGDSAHLRIDGLAPLDERPLVDASGDDDVAAVLALEGQWV